MSILKYHEIETSAKAKEMAKELISINDICETGLFAYWLEKNVHSDFVAIAMFIDEQLKLDEDLSCEDVAEIMVKNLPKNFNYEIAQ